MLKPGFSEVTQRCVGKNLTISLRRFCKFKISQRQRGARNDAATPPFSPPRPQELRSWEEALARAAEEQKEQEEQLKRREQELAEREFDIVERELNILIHQMYQEKPSVKKRKGHFKKSRLLKLGRDGNCISLPSGGWSLELQPGRVLMMKVFNKLGLHSLLVRPGCTELVRLVPII